MLLAELQQRVRDAMIDGVPPPSSLLVGGRDPIARLAVHRRHFEASLTSAITGRFQATGWLVGAARLDAAARDFVRAFPPTAPCIAEYGQQFPAFLAEWPATTRLTYLPTFATLDWQLGRLSVCVDRPALDASALASIELEHLLDAHLTLQEGLYLTRATWGVDELIQMYLADTTTDEWHLQPNDVCLQARGSRGALRFARLDTGTLSFRQALAARTTVAEAADAALATDPTFEPAAALVGLVNEGLITHISVEPEGERS